jgi:hypothetical protein
MFGPSLKSVPGCLVSIVPILIGVPVAATPGFGPHFEMSADPPLELDAPELVVALEPPEAPDPPGGVLVLLLLLPHAASSTAPMTTARATPRRTRNAW